MSDLAFMGTCLLRLAVTSATIWLVGASPVWCQTPLHSGSGDQSSIESEDPRDAKLRELEARLAETERLLRQPRTAVRPIDDAPEADDEIFPTAAAPGEDYRTDTERMEPPDPRFRGLERKV